jgi:very-short-patch-repair endonuclease
VTASELERALLFALRAAKMPAPVLELPFAAPERRFRADLAWPDAHLLAEVDGATYSQGRHSRGVGIHRDCVKQSLAAALGYRTMRFDKQMVESGEALALVERALAWSA